MRAILALLALVVCNVASAATLYVTEFKDRPPVTYQAAFTPFNAEQTVAVAGSSAQSAAFQWNTTLIRVQCDVICNIEISANPTATTSTLRMTAGQTEYFTVSGGSKVAVIAGS